MMKTAVVCNSCGAGWSSDKEICICGRDLNPMRNVMITVSNESDLDMFRPSPEAAHYFMSPMGVAQCDTCFNEWPCHARAWGNLEYKSRCVLCGGNVSFILPEKETNEDINQ